MRLGGLTPIRLSMSPLPCRGAVCSQAARMIQRPTSGAMEDSASASMKAAGAISPRSGWRQRSGASAPITALSASLICG
jgi:hypothetical protein